MHSKYIINYRFEISSVSIIFRLRTKIISKSSGAKSSSCKGEPQENDMPFKALSGDVCILGLIHFRKEYNSLTRHILPPCYGFLWGSVHSGI